MTKSRKLKVAYITIFIGLGLFLYIFFDDLFTRSKKLDNGVVAFKKGEYVEAIKILAPLAEDGNKTAQDLLGLIYAHGYSVPKDKERATKLLYAANGIKAKERFYYIAQRFEKGENVEQDFEEAVSWYIIAADQGDKKAKQRLAQAHREGQLGLYKDLDKAKYWDDKIKGQ